MSESYKERLVRDIMTIQVVVIAPTESLIDAARLLVRNKIHALPVVDNEGIIRGIVAEGDFFTQDNKGIYLPLYIGLVEKLGFGKFVAKHQREFTEMLLSSTVQDIMTAPCVCVRAEDTLYRVMVLIKDTGFSAFPVTDEVGKLLGIITSFDIISSLAVEASP